MESGGGERLMALFKVERFEQITGAFRDLERDSIEVPDGMKFPLLIQDYLTWGDARSEGLKVVVLDSKSQKLVGFVLRRGASSDAEAPTMCEFCHSVRPRGEVSLLVARATRRKWVGLPACTDLSCRDQLLGAPGPLDWARNPHVLPRERVARVVAKLLKFARREPV